MSNDWLFPPSGGGSFDGLNDAGIETFTGARFDGLAREIIQNSLDASADKDSTVTVEFDFVEIKRQEFPGADSLLSTMERCLVECKGRDEKWKKFFKNAIKELSKEKIPCLKISDSGTTGLRGDYHKRKGQWHAITKGRGVSDKDDPTAGGSFGLGKHAPFTVSSLRTIFYATHYVENDKDVYRAQGKSILMSHESGSGGYTQGTGFYGDTDECQPIAGKMPKILQPVKQGCVVFVPGFATEPQWQYKIVATVVANFFYAIMKKKLEVLVQSEKGDLILVDEDSLDKCFEDVVKQEIDIDKIEKSRHYYHAIQAKGITPKNSERPDLGHCKMWVHVAEGLPKRVAIIRKTGMLITDDQDGIKRWTGRNDFAGVFICESDQGNTLLREMENPKHDAFEPDRAMFGKRSECKRALKDMVEWIRGCVDEMAKQNETEISKIDELGKFFPDRDATEVIPGDEGERNLEGAPEYQPKPLKRIKAVMPDDEDGNDDGGGGDGDGGSGGGHGEGPNHGDESGGTSGRTTIKQVEIENVRVVHNTDQGKNKIVYFTPLEDGDVKVEVAVMGDDGRSEVVSKPIAIKAKSGERVSQPVVLMRAVTDSLGVKVFKEVPKSETATK